MDLKQLMLPLAWLIGVIVAALAIAGICMAQLMEATHLFIAILVLVLFILAVTALVALRSYCARRKAHGVNNYDINTQMTSDGKGQNGVRVKSAGVTNAGFKGEEGRAAGGAGAGDKWVSNYVPYGDLPAGSMVTSTSVEVTSEVTSNGDAKWKKNYVEYREEDEKKDPTKE